MNRFPYQRIVVIGTTSAGKSTLANQLAQKIQAEFVDLDSLHWEPNWMEAPDKLFRERVETAIKVDAWVVAGNYHAVRNLIWQKAQALIWLDYPLYIVFWRLLRRTLRRVATREKLFADNVENLWMHLKLWSDESLFHWLFKTYWRRKREYPLLFNLEEYAHLKIIHFKQPSQTERWLKNLTPKPADQLTKSKQGHDHE